MNTAETLQKSKELLENVGWTKYSYVRYHIRSNKATSYCAMGALHEVDGPSERHAITVLAHVIEQNYSDRVSKNKLIKFRRAAYNPVGFAQLIISFNDRGQNLKADILRAFDDAIEIALTSEKETR